MISLCRLRDWKKHMYHRAVEANCEPIKELRVTPELYNDIVNVCAPYVVWTHNGFNDDGLPYADIRVDGVLFIRDWCGYKSLDIKDWQP